MNTDRLLTIGELVQAVQDIARSDEEAVAVLTHLCAPSPSPVAPQLRETSFLPSRSSPPSLHTGAGRRVSEARLPPSQGQGGRRRTGADAV